MDNLKLVLFLLGLYLLSLCANAQVTMGSMEKPKEGSLLELNQGLNGPNGNNSNMGLLLPRVELYHLQRLKMGDFEITDPTEKLAHTGLTVYHIPPTTRVTTMPVSKGTMSDTDIRQDIPAGIYYWDGEKWGRYGGEKETEKPAIELSVTPQLITFGAKETGVKYYTVRVSEGAKWTVTPAADPNWTIAPDVQAGTIAVNPVYPNEDIISDKILALTVTAQMSGAENATAKVSAVQEKDEFIFTVTPTSQSFQADKTEGKVFQVTINDVPNANFDFRNDHLLIDHWIIEKLSSTTFRVTPKDVNTSSEPIVNTLIVFGSLQDQNKEIQITLTHEAAPIDYTADLSLPNCYIISKADTRFTIPIKKAVAVWKSGNWQTTDSNGSLYSLLPEAKDVDKIENLTARVLWYDTKDVVKSVSIEGTGADRNMILDVSGTEGNAVVALYDDKGEILWSWHIWATDQPKEQKFALLNNNIWMDRNLGATETTTRSNGSSYKHKGLLYQWGRKDPFPGSSSTNSTSRVPIYLWNGSGYGSVSSNYPTKAGGDFGTSVDAPGQRLSYSIKNPVDFITTASSVLDWYFQYSIIGGDKTRHWTDRWGKVPSSSTDPIGPKSAMDPCPEGWRVPYPVGSRTLASSPWGETFDGNHTSIEVLKYNGNQYGFRYKEADEVFYPTTGQLAKETGELQTTYTDGEAKVDSPFTGIYWNSLGYTILNQHTAFNLFIASPLDVATTGAEVSGDSKFTTRPAVGGAVRCMKDTYIYNK